MSSVLLLNKYCTVQYFTSALNFVLPHLKHVHLLVCTCMLTKFINSNLIKTMEVDMYGHDFS